MAVKIRLQRMGRKNRPFFRIVAIDEAAKRNGKALAYLGFFDPTKESRRIKVDKKELKQYLSVGAQPTEAVRKLLSL